MFPNDFDRISSELERIAPTIPQNWGGKKQTVGRNALFSPYDIESAAELEERIRGFNETDKKYCRRQWFVTKCNQCDKYLLFNSPYALTVRNGEKGSVIVNGNVFNVKHTVMPSACVENAEWMVSHPDELAKYYYDNISPCSDRNQTENRLFIIHHSFVSQSRTTLVEAAFKPKQVILDRFCEIMGNIKPYKVEGNNGQDERLYMWMVFVLEREEGKVCGKIWLGEPNE